MPPLGARPLEGEQDWRLCLPLLTGSTEAERAEEAAGLPRVAERGLSGRVVLRFGGASKEKPGISDGFHGRDLAVGEVPREGAALLDGAEPTDLLLIDEDDLLRDAAILATLGGADGRRVGVDALDVGRDVGTEGPEGLAVGVEDLAVDLVGVADLAVDLVGVEDLDGPADGAEVLAAVVDLDGVEDLDGPADLVEAVDRVDVNGFGEEE